jgi:hypothetical protein
VFKRSKDRRHSSQPPRLAGPSIRPTDGLSARARAVLGENALARFQEFRQYADGWDFGRGNRLSSASVAALDLFLSSYSNFPTRPSLFMTQAGNLELAWENHGGRRIEVEFCPDRFQYFLDVEDPRAEGEMELRRLPDLIATLEQEDAAKP